jgi:hypothetical protein
MPRVTGAVTSQPRLSPTNSHLPGGVSGGGQHQVIEERVRFAYSERIGKQGDPEQAGDPGLLERWPPCLARQCVRGQYQAQAKGKYSEVLWQSVAGAYYSSRCVQRSWR